MTSNNQSKPQGGSALIASPFDTASGGNGMAPSALTRALGAATAGASQSASRELAETQARYMMAERFPRDERAAMDRILNAFSRVKLAEKAQYQFARGGSDVAGPSIRAAEAIAQQWGNLDVGWREVSRGVGHDGVTFSEVEAFCIDLQARNPQRRTFIVRHWRDTKKGGYALTDERDVYELCANNAMRRVRACILASVPADVVDAAMEQAEVALKTTADTSPEAMAKMVTAFGAFGVSKAQIEARIQRRLDAIQPAQVVSLKRIYASLRDEMSTAADWFEQQASDATTPEAPAGSALAAVRAAAAAATAPAPTPRASTRAARAAPTPTPASAPATTAAAAADPATGEVDAPAPEPEFDAALCARRIDQCGDAIVLDMLRDDVSTLPAGSTRDALMTRIGDRERALRGGASTTSNG